MKALVKTAKGPGNLELREVPVPKAGPVEKIITHCKPLEEWESVFEDIDNQRTIKAVLIP